MKNKNLKRLITLSLSLIMLTLIGCNNDDNYYLLEDSTRDLPKVFYGDYGSEIEATVNAQGQVQFLHNQSLISINPENSTFAVHPRVSSARKFLNNQVLVDRRDITYTSGNDIEQDVSGSNITGKKLTLTTYTLRDDGSLLIKIEIFSDELNNNPNFIIATREFELQ